MTYSLWDNETIASVFQAGAIVLVFTESTLDMQPGVVEDCIYSVELKEQALIVRLSNSGEKIVYGFSTISTTDKEASFVVLVDKLHVIKSLYRRGDGVLVRIDGKSRYGVVRYINSVVMLVRVDKRDMVFPISEFSGDGSHPLMRRINNVIH